MSAREDYPLHVVEAALVWRRCKYATHGNTSEATRRHYQAVQWAERKLSDCLLDLLAEGAAGRGAP